MKHYVMAVSRTLQAILKQINRDLSALLIYCRSLQVPLGQNIAQVIKKLLTSLLCFNKVWKHKTWFSFFWDMHILRLIWSYPSSLGMIFLLGDLQS